jgi:prolyl 4-hydroxylase
LLPGIRVRPFDPQTSVLLTHSHNMASSQPAFRWRTVLELAVIGSVVYFFLGAPGLSDLLASGPKNVVAAPKIQLLKPNSLVFPSPDLECAQHDYEVHIFSAKPLVVYIDGFLTGEEVDALIELR